MSVLAQLSEVVPGGGAAVILAYGPLGAACWWLARLVEKQRAEITARDIILREVTEKYVAAIGALTHKISGLSRALVYNAAAHGTGAVRTMAQREVDRWERQNDVGGPAE